jgi:hypothetical protein
LAEKAGIVELGGSESTAWIGLMSPWSDAPWSWFLLLVASGTSRDAVSVPPHSRSVSYANFHLLPCVQIFDLIKCSRPVFCTLFEFGWSTFLCIFIIVTAHAHLLRYPWRY